MVRLREKIEALIQGLGITPMRFADEIGVSRPIISHILKGRNKPSLEIVQKIKDRFDELGYDWIDDNSELDMDLVQRIRQNNGFNSLFYSSRESDNPDESLDDSQILNSQPAPKDPKKVSQVIIFYEDGTCKIFKPQELGF